MASLDGLNWQQWPPLPDDDQDSSTQSSLAPSPQPPPQLVEQDSLILDPSPSLSPKPVSSSSASGVTGAGDEMEEDVMRLPRRDLHIFGQCPIQDDFILVVCDVCGRHVKMEAFEHHFKLRHERDTKSSSATTLRIKTPRNLRQCTVELIKDDLALSSLSSSCSSIANSGRASSHVASSSGSASQKPSTSPSPVLSIKDEPMDMGDQPPFLDVQQQVKQERSSSGNFVAVEEEEADSTTSNVISIPDTDPLPHSVSNDLMAMVSGGLADSLKTEGGSGGGRGGGGGSGGGGGGSGAGGDGSVPERITSVDSTTPGLQLKPLIKLQIQNAGTTATVINQPLSPMQKLQPPPLVASPLSGGGGGGSETLTSALKKGSPSKKGSKGGGERKPQREYHPDRHCGVWDNENKRHCTRALTCKSHSVLLKRKVEGRSRNFDELVAEHKAVKESQALAAAAAAAAQAKAQQPPLTVMPAASRSSSSSSSNIINVESVLSSITEPNPIDPVASAAARPKMTGWSGPVSSLVTPTMSTVKSFRLSHMPKRLLGSARESDENLHYTLDHPRPLAVCTLGAKRVGGLYVSDRSQLLTRKVIRVAIATNGLRVRNRPNTNAGGGGPGTVGGVKYLQNSTVKRAIQTLQPRPIHHQQHQSGSSYMVNYNLTNVAGTAKKVGFPGGPSPSPIQIASASPSAIAVSSPAVQRIGGVSLSSLAPGTSMGASTSSGNIGVGTIPPNVNIVATSSDSSFKTDIQDFKGGIKFELGRKIKHILPLGSEVTK